MKRLFLIFHLCALFAAGCAETTLHETRDVREIRSAIQTIRRIHPEYSPSKTGPSPDPVQQYLRYYQLDDLDAHHSFGYIPAQNEQIATNRWRQPDNAKGTAVLLHGYQNHTGILAPVIRFLIHEKWNVLALDLPGHGLSTGPRAEIDSFSSYRQVLERVYARAGKQMERPHLFAGHSMGGAVLIDEALRGSRVNMDVLVLMAPLVRSAYWTLSKLLYPAGDLFGEEMIRTLPDVTHDQEYLTFLRHRDPLQPRTIPFNWIEALFDWNRNIHKKTLNNDRLKVTVMQGTGDQVLIGAINFKSSPNISKT